MVLILLSTLIRSLATSLRPRASVSTLMRNLKFTGPAQNCSSSLAVLLFSNAFGLRCVRSPRSSRRHASVVLRILVLGMCTAVHSYGFFGGFFCVFFCIIFASWLSCLLSNMERGSGCLSCFWLFAKKHSGWTGWWVTWKPVVRQTSRSSKACPSFVLFILV